MGILKKISAILFLSIFLQSCYGFSDLSTNGSEQTRTDKAVEDYVRTRILLELPDYNITWTEYAGTGPSICFMGDSRVKAFPVSTYWPKRHIWNISQNVSTLYGVAYRVPKVKEFAPDIIYISVGTNDIVLGETNAWISRYGAVIDDLKTSCPRIYVAGLVPVTHESIYSAAVNPAVPTMNEELRDLCAEKGVTYIDLSALEDGSGALKPELSIDGLHYNQQAYEITYEILKDYF
jgi:hypothetical protein